MGYAFLALIAISIPIATIYAVLQIFDLKRRVSDLENDIRALRTAHRAAEEVPDREPARPQPLQPPPATAPAWPQPVRLAPEMPPPPPRPSAPVPPKPPRASQQEWEALVGGKLLNWIGALALIIGMGFFLKYAFDNNWISPAVRVLLGLITGVALLVFGQIMHRKSYRVFAQGIVGAGIAILYLSMYASFDYYHLVSQAVAFIGMSAVTVVAFQRGLAHDSLAMAVLGWLGGFLTPFLLSTGVVHDVPFFVYIGLLTAGIRAITLWRPAWRVLEYLAFAGWAVLFIGWFDDYYAGQKATLAATVVLAFWATFVVGELIATVCGHARSTSQYVLTSINAAVGFLGLFLVLREAYRYPLAVIILVAGAVYSVAGVILSRRREQDHQFIDQYVLHAIAFLVAATAITFSDFQQVIALAGETVILSWIAARWNNSAVRFGTVAVLVVTLLRFIYIPSMAQFEPIKSFTLLINDRALSLISLTAALVWGSRRLNVGEEKHGQTINQSLTAAWCLTAFLLITFETLDYFRYLAAVKGTLLVATSPTLTTNLTLSLSWTFLSVLLLGLGVRSRAQVIIVAGFLAMEFGLVWILLTGGSYSPPERFALFFNYRAVAIVAVGFALWWAVRLLAQVRDLGSPFNNLGIAARIGLLALGLYFFTVEIWDIFDRSFEIEHLAHRSSIESLESLRNMQQLSLSAVWLFYSGVMIVLGIWRRLRALRMGAIVLFGITILKIFLWDLSFLSGLYRIFSFLGLGVILLAVSFAYQRYKSLIFGTDTVGQST